MRNIVVNIGDVVVKDGVKFRIIGYAQEKFSLCCIDSSKLVIDIADSKDLIQQIEDCRYELIPNTTLEHVVIDLSKWTDEQNLRFSKKYSFVKDIINGYGPLFEKLTGRHTKKLFNEACEKYSFTKPVAWKTVREYLQSGLDQASLADQRQIQTQKSKYTYKEKTGRPTDSKIGVGCVLTEDVLGKMENGRKLFLSGSAKTIYSAYKDMLRKNYTQLVKGPNGVYTELLPANMFPTYKQFYWYVKSRSTEQEIRIAKTSAQEYRNNERLLYSDNLQGVTGPGSLFEIDECELDVFVVSEMDNSVTVGRPIVYAMIDVYSRMIIAVSIAFDNNSFKGLTGCFLNLLEDKKELMAKYGIDIKEDEMPSKIIPQRLRSDYGSEYISYDAERISNELGIQMELAPPGTGSLKGQIEQLFHQLHASQNPLLENHGLIKKDHNSNHRKTATLTITDVKEMIFASVVVHNRKYMQNYPLTAKMIAAHVKPTPIDIWKYGIEVFGSPRVIINEDLFRYSLLRPVSASLSKAGIKFKNLNYITVDDENLLREMQNTKNRSTEFECRIDPRNIGNIYYMRNNKLMTASLNVQKTGMSDLIGLSLEDYEKLYKVKLQADREGKTENLKYDVALQERHEKIVKKASKRKHGPSDSRNLKANRELEKQREALNHMIVPENEDVNNTTQPTVSETNVPKIVSSETKTTEPEKQTVDDILDAIAAFDKDEWSDLL